MSHDDARNQHYYDDFSAHYDHGRDRGYHALVDRLEAELVIEHARGARVLEVGCGTGLVLSKIASVAGHAVGVDLSRGMIEKARSRGLTVVRGSATALPFADDSFDVVYSFKVLAHVPGIERALAELTRVTRPGGIMLLEFYNPWSLRYLARRIAGARRIGRVHTEADVSTRWDSPLAIRRMLPSNASLMALRGIRVLTPAAMVHSMPGFGGLLAGAERWATRSPLGLFGGFLVAIARKARKE